MQEQWEQKDSSGWMRSLENSGILFHKQTTKNVLDERKIQSSIVEIHVCLWSKTRLYLYILCGCGHFVRLENSCLQNARKSKKIFSFHYLYLLYFVYFFIFLLFFDFPLVHRSIFHPIKQHHVSFYFILIFALIWMTFFSSIIFLPSSSFSVCCLHNLLNERERKIENEFYWWCMSLNEW